MSRAPSSSRKVPCSMLATPARVASLIPSAPCACAATRRSSFFASSTSAVISSSVYRVALREHAARRADLDDVGAVLHLVAHRLAHLVHAVGGAGPVVGVLEARAV